MAFEILHDGYVRRYGLFVPADWNTVVDPFPFDPGIPDVFEGLVVAWRFFANNAP